MALTNNKPKARTEVPEPFAQPDEELEKGSASTSDGPKAPVKKPRILSNVDFGVLMDSVASENLNVLYLQARTKLRFLPLLEGRPPVLPVKTVYQGKTRTKYLMGVWNLTRKEGDDGPSNRVQAVLLSKRTVRGVLQYASEGWDLFSPAEGRGIVFVKNGTGLNQEITMSPSPNAIAVPEDVMDEWYAFDMEEVAASWEKSQAARALEKANAEDDEAEEDAEEAPPKRQEAPKKSKAPRNESGW